MKILLSIVVLLLGLFVASSYLGKPLLSGSPGKGTIMGNRPWRKVGAAICLVLSIMFAAGLHLPDPPINPRAYTVYWIVMLILVFWLLLLAMKDVLHTRRRLFELRDELRSLNAGRRGGNDGAKEEEHS